jgi:hypothetical protein
LTLLYLHWWTLADAEDSEVDPPIWRHETDS